MGHVVVGVDIQNVIQILDPSTIHILFNYRLSSLFLFMSLAVRLSKQDVTLS